MTITDDNEVKGKINKRTYRIASTFFKIYFFYHALQHYKKNTNSLSHLL